MTRDYPLSRLMRDLPVNPYQVPEKALEDKPGYPFNTVHMKPPVRRYRVRPGKQKWNALCHR